MAFNLSETNLERIQDHVLQKREEALRNEMGEMHPADIAEVLDRLDIDDARYLHSLLDGEIAAEVITELPEDRREALLEDFSAKEIAEEVIEQLDTDDAA
ncbi:MAG: magnesium transporter, partial [Flavobacteriales bacterium]|nr:magnesium transporter [Flavobacteriales bacterium]